MPLNLSKIMDNPGVIPFETALDLSDLSFGGCCPAQEPVVAKGTVKNSAGVLLMHGTVETTLHGVCDRIDHAVVALNANYGHALSAYAIENERLKARIRELEGGEK